MNRASRDDRKIFKTEGEDDALFPPPEIARASVVNRTRRVIHEEALRMQQDRSRTRSLWVPLAICSALLMVICYAIWGTLAGYDLTPTSIPDASDQMMLLILLWSIPIAAVALGLVWFRRGRGVRDGGGESTL